MKNLEEITEQQARHVAKLLNVDFAGFNYQKQHKGGQVVIRVKISQKGYVETIYIYPTGEITHVFNGSMSSGFHRLNALPVTDYLRKEGFQFEY